jgi:hypothetical protein
LTDSDCAPTLDIIRRTNSEKQQRRLFPILPL